MPRSAGPTCDYRVVQIHPLLRCNLRCLHCYSTSSPEESTALPLQIIVTALNLLRAEGFNAVSISGGEPLLYPELFALLTHASSLGMVTTVTTNGILATQERAEMLHRCANLVAVSLDGVPDSHNRIRGNARAFELMTAGVDRIKQAGLPFAFIFTLTLHNLHELSWIAEFAAGQGAALLQVHPLEEVGRASGALPGSAPDALELARSFVEVARLQREWLGKLTIQFDVADLDLLREEPERGFAVEPFANCGATPQSVRLADLIAPVVIEADGAIVPVQYNFSRSFQIASLHSSDLNTQLQSWKESGYSRFLGLCRTVYRQLMEHVSEELPFANWYGAVLQESHHFDDSSIYASDRCSRTFEHGGQSPPLRYRGMGKAHK